MPRMVGNRARLDRATAARLGVLAWWPMAPAGGRTLADVGPSRRWDGTLVTAGADWRAAPTGPALLVDGTSNTTGVQVVGSGGMTSGLPGLTVAARVFIRSVIGGPFGNFPRLVTHVDTNPWGLLLEANGTDARFYVGNTAAPVTLPTTHVGRWLHVVGTYDGANIRTYADGLVGSPVARTGAVGTSTSDIWVGNRAAGSRMADCLIAEVVIADRAWTAGEVRRWQDNPWTLWAPSGPVVVDFGAALAGAGGGAQSLSLPTIASGATPHAPAVAPGSVTLAVPAIASTATLAAPTVAPGPVTLGLPAIASGATLAAPTLTPGSVSLALPAIASGSATHAPGVTPGGMALLASDDFSEADGTAVVGKSADVGGTWTAHPGSTSAAEVRGGALRRSEFTGVLLIYLPSAGSSAEQEVSCTVASLSSISTNTNGPVGYLDASAATFYGARYLTASTRWELIRSVSGTITVLGSYTQSLSAGTAYALTLRLAPGSQELLVDGVSRITTSDAAISGPGYVGIRGTGSSSETTGTGWRLDNFNAFESAGVSVALPTIPGGSTLHAPAVAPGAVTLAPPSIAPTAALFAPTLGAPSQSIGLPSIASTAALYAPTAVPGSVALALPAIASGAALYAPMVGQGGLVLPAIASGAALHAPTLDVGAVALALPAIASGAALHAPAVGAPSQAIALPSIASGAALHAPEVTSGTVSIALPAIPSTTALHGPTLSTGAISLAFPTIAGAATTYAPTAELLATGTGPQVSAATVDEAGTTLTIAFDRLISADDPAAGWTVEADALSVPILSAEVADDNRSIALSLGQTILAGQDVTLSYEPA